jgi:CHAT domain-containing protein
VTRRGLAIAGALLLTLAGVASAQPPACADGDRIDALLAESAQSFTARNATRGLALLNEAFALSAALGCEVRRAEATVRLARADSYNRKFADAALKLADAAALFARYQLPVREADALLQLGNVLILDGRPADATAPLLRARDLARGTSETTLQLRILSNLAYALEAGPEKDSLRTEGLDFARRAGSETECDILHEWGDDLFTADRYREAFDKLIETVRCFERGTNASKTARAYVSLGRVYRAHGRLAEALEQYARAVALPDEDDPLGAVQSLNAIGVTLGFMGRYGEALERMQEALGMARRIGSPRTVHFLLANVAAFHLDQGRYAEAAAALEEILATPGISYEVLRLADLSRAYAGLKRADRATEVAERAVSAARSDSDQISALAARANAFIAARRFDEAAADLRRAVDTVDAIRSRTVADDFLKRGFSQSYQWLFSSSIALLEDQGRSREAIETAERARARAFLDLLAARSRTQPTSGAAPIESSPATFADITAAAARMHSTVVAFWVGREQTFVWVVQPDGTIGSARIRVTANALAALIREATGSGTSTQAHLAALMLRSSQAARPWRALDRLLLGPIRKQLPARRGSRLTIVPHGPLFALPFAALQSDAGTYLVEAYDLHYVPAIGALRMPQPRIDRGRSALLVGDPGPDAARDRLMPLSALPWADREVSAIDRLLPSRATLLRGRQATEANVRQQLAGRTLLHFATHGIVQNEEHLASYLALRPSDEARDDPGSDGRLTANETYSLQLDADLIVLSGCRTAMGPIIGDGVIGFTRAFLAAGAASVVATMWDVTDQTSFEMMRSFYGAWMAGADKSRALRSAQLAVIRALRAGTIRVNGVALPESPRLWAGYVLVGQP